MHENYSYLIFSSNSKFRTLCDRSRIVSPYCFSGLRNKFCVIFHSKLNCKILKEFITRPNCALDRRTIFCLYVPGFQRQVFKHAPKCKWIPRTYTCNVNFVGTFILLRIPQHANIASCSGFRNCKWIPQNVSGIHKCKRIRKLLGIQKFVYY